MKKYLAMLLCGLLLCCSAALAEEGYLALYQPKPNENHLALQIMKGQTVAQRFTAEKQWDIFTISCPSYGNHIGSLTLSLYCWTGDYDASVAGEALAQRQFINFYDNANLRLFLQQPLPPGDYLIIINDAQEKVGVWYYFNGTYLGQRYLNGKPVKGNLEARVLYTLSDGLLTVPDEYLMPPAP